MKNDDVQAMYDVYAPAYNLLWHHVEQWAPEAANTVEHLRRLVGPTTRWLDVCCGTGYYLSQFPTVERGGLDLTEGMLEEARQANPGATFRQGDARVLVDEWRDRWSLVTSTGQGWGYVDTLEDVRQIADNLAAYTAPDGVLMVPILDLADLTGFEAEPNHLEEREGFDAYLTGCVWTITDSITMGDGEQRVHRDMVGPQLEIWVRWLAEHFRHIEVVRWPHQPPAPTLPVPRRVVVASEKRGDDDDGARALVIDHPPVELLDGVPMPSGVGALAPAPSRSQVVSSPDEPMADEPMADEPMADEPMAGQPVPQSPVDVVEAPSAATDGETARADGVVSLSSTSTRRLVSEVARRMNPLQPGVWRGAARRLRR